MQVSSAPQQQHLSSYVTIYTSTQQSVSTNRLRLKRPRLAKQAIFNPSKLSSLAAHPCFPSIVNAPSHWRRSSKCPPAHPAPRQHHATPPSTTATPMSASPGRENHRRRQANSATPACARAAHGAKPHVAGRATRGKARAKRGGRRRPHSRLRGGPREPRERPFLARRPGTSSVAAVPTETARAGQAAYHAVGGASRSALPRLRSRGATAGHGRMLAGPAQRSGSPGGQSHPQRMFTRVSTHARERREMRVARPGV